MADPHMANVTNSANVSNAIAFHDTFETVFLMSSFTLSCWRGGGCMRSFDTANVMIKKIKAMQAKMAMVQLQPCCKVWPSAK